MNHQIVISEEGAVVQPPLHDAKIRGLLLCDPEKLVVAVVTSAGDRYCLVLNDVERLRADDFRQGNIILDVTVFSATEIDVVDIAYVYGVEPTDNPFLSKTMERLVREDKLLVRINPSFGCAAACICGSVGAESDSLPG